MRQVLANSHVTFHYRLELADGQVLFDTFTEHPATLQLGEGQFSEGLERCMIALQEGEEKPTSLVLTTPSGRATQNSYSVLPAQPLKTILTPKTPSTLATCLNFPARTAGVLQVFSRAGKMKQPAYSTLIIPWPVRPCPFTYVLLGYSSEHESAT